VFTFNRWLPDLVKAKKFRHDLFDRIWNPDLVINLLPLRERKEDIPHIVNYFLFHCGKKYIHKHALEKLIKHTWPGNFGELQKKMEALSVLTHSDSIEPQDVQFKDSISTINSSSQIIDTFLKHVVMGNVSHSYEMIRTPC
jgi:DNA-binding NtrC family response regulator